MHSRYFSQKELEKLFERNTMPTDISIEEVIGVSEPCSISLVVEQNKVNKISQEDTFANYQNIATQISEGSIWIVELNAFSIGRLLLEDDFFEDHCDKHENPYVLSSRMTLYFDSSYSYWSENVYLEAFE